ncbi:MAG TPA: hypothetical protein PL110_06315 [Candidatus Eremiobacteraeota bacterium]|nr:hypothetical protein [Candidatus Eremiobacteraeota bacterium]
MDYILTLIKDNKDIFQCAWCRCLMKNGIKIKETCELLNISHGICLSCWKALEEKEM